MIDKHQHQIILGALLGNGRIKDNRLILKSNDYGWFESKTYDLRNFLSHTWQSRGNYYWSSIEGFGDLYPDFNEKKQLVMPLLDQLRDDGIATWFGDVGCLVGREHACLRTQQFKEQNTIICQYFNEVGIPCNLNKMRDSHVLVFTKSGTNVLIGMIKTLLPLNRYHLIPKRFLCTTSS